MRRVHPSRLLVVAALLPAACVLSLSGCNDAEKTPGGKGKGGPGLELTVRSTAFSAGKAIPKRHTADGDDVSPPLAWSDLPAGTKELAVIVDDPDAPTDQPFVHWVIYKIPADQKGLAEGIATSATLTHPPGAMQGRNSFGTIGYRGPDPPSGVHHYHFKVYALDAALAAAPGLDKKGLLAAMSGHVLAEGKLVGTYQR